MEPDDLKQLQELLDEKDKSIKDLTEKVNGLVQENAEIRERTKKKDLIEKINSIESIKNISFEIPSDATSAQLEFLHSVLSKATIKEKQNALDENGSAPPVAGTNPKQIFTPNGYVDYKGQSLALKHQETDQKSEQKGGSL